MAIRRHRDWEFLYVPSDEIAEARALGAIHIPGDARLVVPTPLPPGVTVKSFDRWRSNESKYRWCFQFLRSILSEMVPSDSESTRKKAYPITPDMSVRGDLNDKQATQTIAEIFATLGRLSGETDRVYLYPTPREAPELRHVTGVHWDRRKRAYYATDKADMTPLFKYMTPSAQLAWQGAKTATRAMDWLVQEQARQEAERRSGSRPAAGGKSQSIEAKKRAEADTKPVFKVSTPGV